MFTKTICFILFIEVMESEHPKMGLQYELVRVHFGSPEEGKPMMLASLETGNYESCKLPVDLPFLFIHQYNLYYHVQVEVRNPLFLPF